MANTAFQTGQLFIRKLFQLNRQDFETDRQQIRHRRLQKPLQGCFCDNPIEIERFLKK
jgi:hypothetical protein